LIAVGRLDNKILHQVYVISDGYSYDKSWIYYKDINAMKCKCTEARADCFVFSAHVFPGYDWATKQKNLDLSESENNHNNFREIKRR
jgi:hypothetical protein